MREITEKWDNGKLEQQLRSVSRGTGVNLVEGLCTEIEIRSTSLYEIFQAIFRKLKREELIRVDNSPEEESLVSEEKQPNKYRGIILNYLKAKDDQLIVILATLIQRIISN